jgi:hypothetical protein
MTTTWTIAIDWDRNGNYSDTYDDISSRMIEAKWFLGMQKLYQEIADDSKLELTLDNSDKRFSPDNASSPLYGKLKPFRPVRVQSNDGTTTRTHWVGWIDSFEPLGGQYGKRTIKISATGPMQFFLAAETKLALQENKRTDAIIAELIKEVVIPPALTGAWVLGRVGYSELGATTQLANTTAYSQLDAGIKTLDLAGDNWVRQGGMSDVEQDTYDVYRAINDVTAAERGRFLFDREGKALFWNRHHLLDEPTVAVTLNDTMNDMAYVYAGIEDVKNEIIVVCHPRSISEDAQQVLWKLTGKVQIGANSTYEMYVKYEDETKNRIGGRDVTYADLDFESGGASLTLEPKANGANLVFKNTSNVSAVVKSLTLVGQKISDLGQMEAKATDNASIIDYGRRTLKLNLPSIGSLEEAQYIADFESRRRAQPRGFVRSVKLYSHGVHGGWQHAHQLARTLGDVVRIQESQTGHDSNYHIIGEMQRLFNAGEILETTWQLEPAPVTPFPWKLGVSGRSNLGTSTRLTY